MPNESGFEIYIAYHQHLAKLKQVTQEKDFHDDFVKVLLELGWYRRDIVAIDTQHQPGIGLSTHLEQVFVMARTKPQSMSLLVNATNYGQVARWNDFPDIFRNHFPAREVHVLAQTKSK